jgi:hypothetical protein
VFNCRVAILLATCLSLTNARAQNMLDDTLGKNAALVNQLKASMLYAQNNCSRLNGPKQQECKDFYVQAIRNADDQLKAIEAWRTAVKENNKPEIWQAIIKYS